MIMLISARLSRLALLAVVFAVSLAGPASAHESLMVEHAFARASATPAAKAGAAYFTIVNHGHTDQLLGVRADGVAKKAILHESVTVDGIAKMEHRHNVSIPMHGTVVFKPGGLHVMLMGLQAPLKEGDTFPLTLAFEKAGDVDVQVHVGGIAADGADHSNHGDHGEHSGHGTTD